MLGRYRHEPTYAINSDIGLLLLLDALEERIKHIEAETKETPFCRRHF